MITKTLNLDEAYQELFDEVREKSNGQINVSNLEAFFGSITEIATLDPKFLRLPLDEPFFEIDANTRKITVPENFRTNGASVQGDHLAEIIFFRIARFFDYTDLSTCDITINWKMGTNEGKTSRFIKFDKPYKVVDMNQEAETSYVVFGWPINDVVTEKSGQLTFAVEFSKKATNLNTNEEEIIYRFNTLPTTVNIKDGLVIGENVEVVSLDTDIIRTLINSSFGEGTAAVGDLRWLTGNGEGLVVGEGNYSVLQDFAATINLPTNIVNGIPSSGAVKLYAQGFIDEGTKIQYTDMNNVPVGAEGSRVEMTELAVRRPLEKITTLDSEHLDGSRVYYKDEDGSIQVIVDPEDPDTYSDFEFLYTPSALIEGLRYDKKVSDNPPAYEQATEADLATWAKRENVVEIFMPVARMEVQAAGAYVIRGQGYKMDNNEQHKIGSGEVKSTSIVTVPHVVAPSGVEVEVSAPAAVSEGYSFADDIENVVFLNNGQGTMTASAILDADKLGALKFDWEKKVGDSNAFVAVNEDVEFQEENESVLNINEAGQYKVKVTNFLNAGFAPVVESAVITASPLAGKIVGATIEGRAGNRVFGAIPENGLKYNSTLLSMSSASLRVNVNSIELEEGGALGELEFQWQKEMADDNLETRWEDILGAVGSELTITSGDGVFRPVIKNNYNGSIYTFALNGVSVDNLAT